MNMTSIVKYVLVLCVLFVAGYTNAQITINTNFSVLSNQPIDSRDTLTTLADTSSVTWTFPGLLSYVVDIDEFWYYTGTQWRKLFDGTTIPSTVPDSLIVYAPAHGLSDTIALYGYVPVKADFTRANSTSIDSVFIAYAIDAPDTDSLTLIFSGVLTYGSWHGKELNTQYYLQDDGSDDTTPGTVSVPTAIASDSLTLFLREVGSDIAGQLRRVAMPSPLITAFGGNPASPTDAVVQAAIEGAYLPAGLAQPGTIFTLSYATQSYNPTYQQTAPNTNPLTPSYAWLWDGALATRIVNIPTSVNLQDVAYGVLGTLVLLPIDSLMAASVPTDTEVALWLDTNYTANNLRLANGSLLYFIGDSTRQNPEYIWQVIDDISYDAGDTDWEKILKRLKFPGTSEPDSTIFATVYALADTAAAIRGDIPVPDGNGIFDATNDGDTTAIGSVVLGEDLTVELNNHDWLFDGLVEDNTTSRIMTLRGDGSLAYRWLDSLLNGYTTGSGTPGTLTIWTGANALGNSSLTESGGNVLATSFTGAFGLATGTTAQAPVGANGRMRYNTTENGISAWNGAAAAWQYLPWADVDNFSNTRIPYSNGTNLTSSANLFYDGTDIGVTSGNFRVVSTGFGLEHPSSTALGLYYSTSNPKIFFNLHTGGNETYMEWRTSGGSARAKLGNGSGNSYTNEASSSSISFATTRITSLSYNSNLSITGAGASSGQTGSSVTIEGGCGTNINNGNHVYLRGGGINVGAGQGPTGETGDVVISLYPDINTDTGQYPAVIMQRFRASGNVTNRTNWEVYRLNATTSGIRTLTMESDTVKYRIENIGTISTSTDGSGDIVVAHGMGVTPTSVQVAVTGTTPYVVTVHTIGSTNFTVRFYDMTGAAVTSTAVTATWHCKT